VKNEMKQLAKEREPVTFMVNPGLAAAPKSDLHRLADFCRRAATVTGSGKGGSQAGPVNSRALRRIIVVCR